MSPHLTSFVKKHRIVVGIAAIALAATLFFGGKFLADVIYFNDPAHRNANLEGWMTPRYVVMSYRLPPHVVDDVFELEPHREKRRPLRDIADELGLTMGELTERLRTAQAEFRATHR